MGILTFFHTYLPSSVIVELGPVAIHWYGLLLAISILVGYSLTKHLWRRSGRQLERLDQLVLWLILAGFVGARLVDVFLFEWRWFREDWWLIPQVWQGGLAIHGALAGGLMVVLWQARRFKDSAWQILDILAPAAALGQAIGRWGNYFNQELFGLPTNLPWGIPIEPVYRPASYLAAEQFHPAFVYESLALVVIFLVLWKLYPKLQRLPGTIFLIYLSAVSVVRLLLEFIRVDEQLTILGWRSGLVLAVLLLVVAGWFWLRRLAPLTSQTK